MSYSSTITEEIIQLAGNINRGRSSQRLCLYHMDSTIFAMTYIADKENRALVQHTSVKVLEYPLKVRVYFDG